MVTSSLVHRRPPSAPVVGRSFTRRELFFAAALLLLPVAFAAFRPTPADAAGDPELLAELLADDEPADAMFSRSGSRESEFPGGSLLQNELDPELLNDVDGRLAPPFRFVRRRDTDIDDPFVEDDAPAPAAPAAQPERPPRSAAARDPAGPTPFPPASVREVRPDRFPFRSVLDPPDPVDGLRRK